MGSKRLEFGPWAPGGVLPARHYAIGRRPLAASRHIGYGVGMSSQPLSASSARTRSPSALALILGGLLLLRLART